MQRLCPTGLGMTTAVAVALLLATLSPLFAAPDIDVVYISRTPRYSKYMPQFLNGIDPLDWGNGQFYLSPEEAAKQRWPSRGELITFTAVIKNPSDSPTGSFQYKWYFDGVEVESGTLSSVPSGGQTSTTYTWTWDSEWNDHTIKFVADPANLVAESVESNNSREDRTNALSFRIHCWQSVYDWFHANIHTYNPNLNSFDDWIQAQLGYMNQLFKDAIWPLTPNGILERVRLDEIVIEPDGTEDPDPNACHAPPDELWDCRWGFGPKEYPKIFTEEYHYEFLSGPYTWILHEWGHQLGQIDVYQLSYGPQSNPIQPFGHMQTRSYCMMSGNDLSYSDQTAYSLTMNLHKRRGYFGEYLYDLPGVCRVRLVDAYYRPIPYGTIKFHQKVANEILPSPTFTLTTDSAGYCTLPNRTCYGSYTTGTGHTLRNNPFGIIHPAATNANFFCEITKSGQTDYQYMEITPFNMAYWVGYTDTYSYYMQTTLIPSGRPVSSDLYGVKTVSENLAYAVGANGKILRWDGTTWSVMTSPVTSTLRAVDANATSGLACAVGDSGALLIKSGTGEWVKKTLSSGTLYACAVISPNTIIVAGDSGAIYRSTNSGATWSRITTTVPTYITIRSLSFWDDKKGVLICDSGIWYTTDGGTTWIMGGDYFSGGLTDCCMASATEAWACTDGGSAYKSTNGGATWTRAYLFGYTEDMYGISLKGGDGWCAGGLVEQVGNIGIKHFWHGKWVNEYVTTSGSMDTVFDISCLTGDEAWAVGKGGLILHLVNSNVPTFVRGSLKEILEKPDGTSVTMEGLVVTGSFSGCVYVESQDRSCGLKVLTTQVLPPGAMVRVTGALDTIGLERVIRRGDVGVMGQRELRPLGMSSRSVTGSADDPGLSSIPRLVKLFGKVTASDSNNSTITVDDGSGRVDSAGHRGVKVAVNGPVPSAEVKVMVVGVSSFETVAGKTYPLIRTRRSEDIQTVPGGLPDD